MLDKLQEYIESHNLIKKSDKLAIAVSGGKDSMCAVHLFNNLGRNFSVVHCNFKLRDEDSNADETFVVDSCGSLEHCEEVHTRSFNTLAYAEEHGISTQEAARELRYDYFEQLHQQKAFDTLITAHHKDDNVETFLINAYRVSGSKGLAGIPVKRGYLVRPLLGFNSSEIKSYIAEHSIAYREDRSNASSKYLRNSFRNLIIPKIEEILPDFSSRIDQTSSHLRSDSKLLEHYLSADKLRLLVQNNEGYSIDIQELETYPQSPVFLYYLLDAYGFTLSQCQNILSANTGSEVTTSKHRILKDRGQLLIQARNDHSELNVSIERLGTYDTAPVVLELKQVEAADLTTDSSVEYARLEAFDFPLTLRFWEEGDYIYPLGMDHKKLLSDYFIDSKIDRLSKHRIPLLVKDKEVLWILGYRLSNKLKLEDKNSPCCQLKFASKDYIS